VQVVTPFVFRADLRRMLRAPEWRAGQPIREIPRRFYPREGAVIGTETPRAAGQPADPLLERQTRRPERAMLRSFATPNRSFSGQPFSGVNPPDTVGDVGLDHYIQMTNDASGAVFTIYNKSDGTVAAGPTTLDSMGSGNCADGLGDPIVLFDRMAKRWLLSEFSNTGNELCVYISQTSDPLTGGWFNYGFAAPKFPDYPKYGVWPDAYYVSSNEDPDPAVYALERSQMLLGAPASMLRFTAPSLSGFGFQALTPSDLDGTTAPPAGSPNYFVRHRDDERHSPGTNDPARDFLELWEFSANFTDPASSTFAGPFPIGITEIDSGLCGFTSFSCFSQPGGGPRLDPLREIVMRRFQYRNFGTHQTLVGSLVTDVDGTDRGGVRWYELRKSGAGPWALFQEGTYSPDANNRFMSSVAMDGRGNIGLGYNVVSSSVFPSLRYAGRLANDPPGVLTQGEFTLANGTAANASGRYGDYSSLNVDPVDDCTLWLTGEHNTSGQWSTRIGSFSLGDCGQPVPPFDLQACQRYCDDAQNLCRPLTGVGESVCTQVFASCRQICAGQPPP
jgi:hypothetical protein